MMVKQFDARTDSPAIRAASGAFVDSLLAEIMPHLTLAARGCGYSLAVHGSRARDIDMIAVPWVEHPEEPEFLLDRLCGVLAGFLGRALPRNDWEDKPHGRRSVLIITPGGMVPEIDLSIMPVVKGEG